MSITFLDHYFLKDEKKYAWVVQKLSRSVSGAPHCMCIFKYKKGKDQNSDEFEINTAMLLYSVDNEKSDFKLEVLFMIYNIMSKQI